MLKIFNISQIIKKCCKFALKIIIESKFMIMENQEVNPIPTTPVMPPRSTGAQVMLPGVILWMIFGIVSACSCCIGWIPVAGIVYSIIGIVFGILAFVKGKKLLAMYDANPANYKPASQKMAKTAKITGLIGFIVSIVMLCLSVILTAFMTGLESHSSQYYY
jgi:hypothetical protein